MRSIELPGNLKKKNLALFAAHLAVCEIVDPRSTDRYNSFYNLFFLTLLPPMYRHDSETRCTDRVKRNQSFPKSTT